MIPLGNQTITHNHNQLPIFNFIRISRLRCMNVFSYHRKHFVGICCASFYKFEAHLTWERHGEIQMYGVHGPDQNNRRVRYLRVFFNVSNIQLFKFNPTPIGLFWPLYDKGNPLRKQCSSSARTAKFGTGIDPPQDIPVPNWGVIA